VAHGRIWPRERVKHSMSTDPGPGYLPGPQGPQPTFPRIALGVLPTPLHRLTGLMSAFGHGPELLAKREDLCGIAAGGNKVRKLAALLGQALSQRATVVLTTGGVQSNHCALTAAAAAMYGLRAELYLSGPQPPGPAGNLLIEELAGAAVTFLGDCSDRDRDDRIAARTDKLRAMGEVPYPIPLGGSTPLGAAAYADAVPELAAQLGGQPVTHLVVAAGSLGTMAGLILGTWASGLDCQVHGYTVLWPQAEAITRLDELLEAARREYFPAVTARPNYEILDAQLGAGYGAPTAAGREAARLAARHDGLLLDHTYTAKAMAGLIQGIRGGIYTHQHRVVFIHTGGLAGFFAAAGMTPNHSS
jgi:1-aminocyclopropane-1-carboxylate deaminase/D-cysteine desulfhydrase-like pyridoxal-dependent ACC family enzyme